MKNYIQISNDGKCVFIETRMIPSLRSRIVIPIILVLILLPAIYMTSAVIGSGEKELIFGIFFLSTNCRWNYI